jgi:hypothetical protein
VSQDRSKTDRDIKFTPVAVLFNILPVSAGIAIGWFSCPGVVVAVLLDPDSYHPCYVTSKHVPKHIFELI